MGATGDAAASRNLAEIVAKIRGAGNPRKTAMELLADTDDLEDAELLAALGAKAWGDLPTVPYPDAQERTPPDGGGQAEPSSQSERAAPAPAPARKKPGPKPGSRPVWRTPKGAEEMTPAQAGQAAQAASLADARRELSKKRRAELERGLAGLTDFGNAWCESSIVRCSPLGKADEDTILRLHAKAVAYLQGWDALADMLDGKF